LAVERSPVSHRSCRRTVPRIASILPSNGGRDRLAAGTRQQLVTHRYRGDITSIARRGDGETGLSVAGLPNSGAAARRGRSVGLVGVHWAVWRERAGGGTDRDRRRDGEPARRGCRVRLHGDQPERGP